jgi:hypothetical protein
MSPAADKSLTDLYLHGELHPSSVCGVKELRAFGLITGSMNGLVLTSLGKLKARELSVMRRKAHQDLYPSWWSR